MDSSGGFEASTCVFLTCAFFCSFDKVLKGFFFFFLGSTSSGFSGNWSILIYFGPFNSRIGCALALESVWCVWSSWGWRVVSFIVFPTWGWFTGSISGDVPSCNYFHWSYGLAGFATRGLNILFRGVSTYLNCFNILSVYWSTIWGLGSAFFDFSSFFDFGSSTFFF